MKEKLTVSELKELCLKVDDYGIFISQEENVIIIGITGDNPDNHIRISAYYTTMYVLLSLLFALIHSQGLNGIRAKQNDL